MKLLKKESLWDRPHRCAQCQILTKCRIDFTDEEGHIVCSITLCSICQNDKRIVEKWFNRFKKIKN